MQKADIKQMALMWFAGEKINKNKERERKDTEEVETKEVSRISGNFNHFVKIFDSQEKPQAQIDNRSQLSDFSLRLNPYRKTSEDFFDF